MRTRSIVVSLVVLVVCGMTAAPGFAAEITPAPKSYTAIDVNGGVQECIDFKRSGVAYFWINDRNGNFQTLDVSAITGTPADSVYFVRVQNLVNFDFTPFVNRLEFHGSCEAQGGAWWGIGGSWGNASCGFTTYIRGTFGRFNSNQSMIQVGPDYGDCEGLWGRIGNAKIDKSTRR